MSSGRVTYMRLAMTKQCPLQSRMHKQHLHPCIGDQCMAWRFVEPYITQRTYLCDNALATTEPDRPAAVPDDWVFHPFDGDDSDPASWIQPAEDARLSADGYCAMVPE